MPMVGRPEIRRGSLTFVTRPSIVAPAGITILPFSVIGWVTLPWNGSPALLLNVASVVSSLTIRAVPAGTGALVWAASMVASNVQGNSIHFFIRHSYLKLLSNLTVDHAAGGGKPRCGHGEPAKISARLVSGRTVPELEI